jgi:nucleotide-binding universal stress UspA family protein
MTGPLLVALDGSDKDARAVAVATAISRLSERSIHLVSLIGEPPRDLAGVPVAQGLNESAARDEKVTEARLAQLAEAIRGSVNRDATWSVLRTRDIAATLITHAVEQDALLLVLGTRAAGGGSRAFVGSVADHVMRESPRPVVLVPPGAAYLAGKEPTIKRVLVPLDGSSLAFRSLEFLIELPHAADLEYVLMEVVSHHDKRTSAEPRLRTTAAWLRSRGAQAVEERIAVARDPAVAITDAVRDVLPDGIVMSTRGAGGLGRLVLGSVAEGVVRRSELPVMLLTPRVLAEPMPR